MKGSETNNGRKRKLLSNLSNGRGNKATTTTILKSRTTKQLEALLDEKKSAKIKDHTNSYHQKQKRRKVDNVGGSNPPSSTVATSTMTGVSALPPFLSFPQKPHANNTNTNVLETRSLSNLPYYEQKSRKKMITKSFRKEKNRDALTVSRKQGGLTMSDRTLTKPLHQQGAAMDTATHPSRTVRKQSIESDSAGKDLVVPLQPLTGPTRVSTASRPKPPIMALGQPTSLSLILKNPKRRTREAQIPVSSSAVLKNNLLDGKELGKKVETPLNGTNSSPPLDMLKPSGSLPDYSSVDIPRVTQRTESTIQCTRDIPLPSTEARSATDPRDQTIKTAKKSGSSSNFVRLNLRNSAGSCRGARNKKSKWGRGRNRDEMSSMHHQGRQGVFDVTKSETNAKLVTSSTTSLGAPSCSQWGVDPVDDFLDGVYDNRLVKEGTKTSGCKDKAQMRENAAYPNCSGHQQPCKLLTVKKKGTGNKGRKFYCCSFPRGEQCSYFQWADDTVQVSWFIVIDHRSSRVGVYLKPFSHSSAPCFWLLGRSSGIIKEFIRLWLHCTAGGVILGTR